VVVAAFPSAVCLLSVLSLAVLICLPVVLVSFVEVPAFFVAFPLAAHLCPLSVPSFPVLAWMCVLAR